MHVNVPELSYVTLLCMWVNTLFSDLKQYNDSYTKIHGDIYYFIS